MRLCNHYVPLIFSVQLLSIFEHSIHLRTFNLWMNGPRVHWARGLQLVFQLFIIFNKGEILQFGDEVFDQENPQENDKTQQDDKSNTVYYVSSILAFMSASHMAVQQLLLLRLSNANKGSAQEFLDLPILRQYGMSTVLLWTHIDRLLSPQENSGHYQLWAWCFVFSLLHLWWQCWGTTPSFSTPSSSLSPSAWAPIGIRTRTTSSWRGSSLFFL